MASSPTIRPGGIPDGPRRRVPASTMLLHEWSSLRYPQALVLYQLRLGPTSIHLLNRQVSPELERMLRVKNWYADAVILTDSEGLIVEAKVEPTFGAVGQVKGYYSLYFSTPELQPYLSIPFSCAVLFAEEDDAVTKFALAEGVRVFTYTPMWIADYLYRTQFRNRWAPSPSEETQEGET